MRPVASGRSIPLDGKPEEACSRRSLLLYQSCGMIRPNPSPTNNNESKRGNDIQ